MATSAPTDRREPAASAAHYLSFALGGELFALDIRSVREIIQVGPMTAVPLMPDFVRGVINLRGAVVPVIDPQARFGRPAATLGKRSCIVILEGRQTAGERGDLGLLVDAVNAVVDIADDRIEDAPDFGSSVRRDFLRGLARLPEQPGQPGQRFMLVLDPDHAFDIDDMAVPHRLPRIAPHTAALAAAA